MEKLKRRIWNSNIISCHLWMAFCFLISLFITRSNCSDVWEAATEYGMGFNQPTCNIYGMEDESDCRLISQTLRSVYELCFVAVALGVSFVMYRRL